MKRDVYDQIVKSGISLVIGLNYPANTKRQPSDVILLFHRLLRWPNIITTLGQRLMFAGYIMSYKALYMCYFRLTGGH